MVKLGIANTKMLLLRSCREAKRVKRSRLISSFSKAAGHDNDDDDHQPNYQDQSRNSIKERKMEGPSCWVPHPRTGIYVPEGKEWVVDDVPETAVSFNHTYWLRNVDGAERPDPDLYITSDH